MCAKHNWLKGSEDLISSDPLFNFKEWLIYYNLILRKNEEDIVVFIFIKCWISELIVPAAEMRKSLNWETTKLKGSSCDWNGGSSPGTLFMGETIGHFLDKNY